MPLLNRNAFASVGPPQSCATTPFGAVRPLRLHAGENAQGLQAADEVAVERHVDGAGAADDLTVVVDRLAADGRELLLDGDRRALVDIGDDPDLRASRDALLGLREHLLRLTERVHDGRGQAGLLEGVLERRRVELLPAHGRRRVRQQDAYLRRARPARGCAGRGDRDGDCGRGNSDEERR